MAANSALYRMADRMTEGRLDDIVRELRSQGFSWQDIAKRLYAKHGVEVSSEALRQWYDPEREGVA